MPRLRVALMALLLSGCSSHLLEDVVEVGQLAAPRPCTEPTKLFGAFTLRANKTAWTGDKNAATLTVDLTVTNDKNFPLALSNSGNGVLYTVEVRLQNDKGNVAPKEASGIVLMRAPKEFREPRRPGPFGYITPPTKPEHPRDETRDLNYRIKPSAPESGKLVFQAPRGNYLLTVERKFANKPAGGQPADHMATCKIAAADGPESAPAAPGLY